MLARLDGPMMPILGKTVAVYLIHTGLIIPNTTIDISPIIILVAIYNRWPHIDRGLNLGLVLIPFDDF